MLQCLQHSRCRQLKEIHSSSRGVTGQVGWFGLRNNSTAHDGRARTSQLWVPTGGIAATADDANESVSPLVRGGFLRQAYSGIFHLLPLGLRVQNKLEALVDKHMQSLGASKIALATITSEKLWRKSGRFTGNNPEMFQLASPEPTGYLLSPTHEEEVTNLVANAVTSYKDLPLRLYQISRKYRNELRPRQGLLRTREFLMKDLYTFDTDTNSALSTYESVKTAYRNFFDELTVPYLVADADTGMMGGDLSHEFHYVTSAGEDTLISCESCNYTVNDELAAQRGLTRQKSSPVDDGTSNFISSESSVNESEADVWAPCPTCRGALTIHRAVELGHTFHLGTRYSEPLNASVGIPTSQSGLSTTSSSHKTKRQNESEYKRVPLSMGCHGIGLSRLIGAIPTVLSATSPNSTGLIWPRIIAPFDVLLFSTSTSTENTNDSSTATTVSSLYDSLTTQTVHGTPIDALIDDRGSDVSAGWKFRDAELIGYPVVVVLGRAWRRGERVVEVQARRLGVKEEVAVDGLVQFVRDLLARL